MKRLLTAIMCLIAVAAFAGAGSTPYQGAAQGRGFSLTVIDNDIDAAWELVTADTGFTALAAPDSLSVAYAWLSQYDSLSSGAGPNILAVWSLGDTGDESPLNNLLTPSAGTPAFASAVFSSGFSYTAASPVLYIYDGDSDFNLGTAAFAISLWARSPVAANPSATQTVFSTASSPDYIKIDFNTAGKIVCTFTDDAAATTDVITGTTDIYDAAWHHINVERRTNTIYLTIDGADDANGALTNAAGSLDPDSVWVNAARNNTTPFQGMLDEVYVTTETRGAEFSSYIYKRGVAPDTAYVHVIGISNSDTLRRSESLTVPMSAHVATDSVYKAFSQAWIDTAESQPLITWSAASTPRQAKLDSIPANLLHYPVAHLFFGKNDQGVLNQVIYSNFGANAITYELRVYSDLNHIVDYTKNYDVKCPAYVASGGGPAIFDFGETGLYLGPQTYVAVWALGGGANSKGSATLVGRRSNR
uniref:Putative baseplate wedge initiator n=1 Tax=viral metagenome TaxID=1070528 RepID=A0A6H1ZBF4_9ZZZZ